MQSLKRERSANFSTAEVQLLVSLVEKYRLIIENKKTDAVTNKDKETAWKKIENSFNSCGISTSVRSWKTLKLKYEGIKKTTKKKSSLQRQEMYRTGGGPSNAPEFNDVEEKVLSICSNITGLEARHDSDIISIPIAIEEIISDDNFAVSSADTPKHGMENTAQATQIPDLDKSAILQVCEDNDSQKENKWDKWHPQSLKTKVSKALKSHPTRASVTSQLDKLSTARLELVQLQIENARREHQFMEEQHKIKMLHLSNDERRREEIHAAILEKISCGSIPSGMNLV